MSYYGKCPELTRGARYCKFGCTWQHTICHMYMENRCWWQHAGSCYKGAHPTKKYAETKRRVRERRSCAKDDLREVRSPSDEESDIEGREPRPKKIRLDRGANAEADFQIALAYLDLDTQTPSRAALKSAYKTRMNEIETDFSAEEALEQAAELTEAFRCIATHLDLF